MFRNHYDGWRTSRMNGVKKYISPDYFKSKTLLELGCGYADIGNMFYDLGAIVTSSDVRKEHLEVVKDRHPHIKTLLIDGDNDAIKDKYDIIVHWGLLYHLNEIELHLEKVLQKCDVLLLETEVSDSEDTHFYISTDEYGPDQAFNSKGIRPSPSYVERVLEKNGFQCKLIKDPILNSGFHCYDWGIRNSNTWRHGLRRFWICWKNIDSPLVGCIPSLPVEKISVTTTEDLSTVRNTLVDCERHVKRLRIAVLFYGRTLFYKEHYDRFVNNLGNGNDLDFFLSQSPELGENIDDFVRLYKPISVINETITEKDIYEEHVRAYFQKWPERYSWFYKNTKNLTQHFINKKRVANLLKEYVMKSGVHYDFVCVTRVDISIVSKVDWTMFEKEDKLYIPDCADWGGINDQLCIGNVNSIEKYCSIYENSPKLIENGGSPFPELLLSAHIKDLNIRVTRFPMEYYIIRKNINSPL